MGLAGSQFHAARPPWAGGENATGNVYGDGRYPVARPQGGPWPMQDDDFGGQQQVSRPSLSWNRPISTEIYSTYVTPVLVKKY
jgi:hypothetical protein